MGALNSYNSYMMGEIDSRPESNAIKKININEKQYKCPLCDHMAPILTIAHMKVAHDILDIAEAKDMIASAEITYPFLERGLELRKQLKNEQRKNRRKKAK